MKKKDEVTKEIIARFKTIPRVSILRLSGYTNYCRHVDLNEMRKKYNCPIIDLHLSLDGRSWDSEAEACNANFLLSRGVIIDKKEFYSNEFQEMTNLSRAKYDGSFWSEIQQRQIYFEIWGNNKDKGGPNGLTEEYVKKRVIKEKYHENINNFLGIEFTDCISENKLIEIYEPFVPNINVRQTVKPDKLYLEKIESTKWTIMEYCLYVCKLIKQENNICCLPLMSWISKGKKQPYKDRLKQNWENFCNGATFVNKLKCIGIDKIRLETDNKHCNQFCLKRILDKYYQYGWIGNDYNLEILLMEFLNYWNIYEESPHKILNNKNNEDVLSKEQKQNLEEQKYYANRITNKLHHYDSDEVYTFVGAKKRNHLSDDEFVSQFISFYQIYNELPSNIRNKLTLKEKKEKLTDNEEELKDWSANLYYKSRSYCEARRLKGECELLKICGMYHEKKKKKINQIDKETSEVLKTWDSINDAARYLANGDLKQTKNNAGTISVCLQKKTLTSKGYKWEYCND